MKYILISAIVAKFANAQQADGGAYFFDLSKDPLESNNLFYTDNAKYSTNKLKMTNKLTHWAAKVVAPDSPDEGKKKSKWKRAGGIVPWLDDTTTREVTQIYRPNNPPNIVFILVDDWGWNDVGYQSTYLNFTTPTIDRLAKEGIKLTNYWTSPLCTPSRGALMTGKYAFRLGLSEERSGGELPLAEVTIAEEMKSAGYRTYMVGKWHLGMSSYARTPTYRGFDYFYGYYNGFVDYWSKSYSGFLDLQDNDQLETDPEAISPSVHNAYLMAQKAVDVINKHAVDFRDAGQPFFLYYASQLIHEDWAAPDSFIQRCTYPGVTAEQSVYCGMNLMLDETVSNITCALANNGFADNTIIVIASDNGGVSSMPGNSFPFKGSKGSYFRGGLSAAAFMHGSPIPKELRGTSYDGEVHVTDWLPTLMGLATDHQWEGSLIGESLDGVDMWYSVTSGGDSPHSEIVHYMDEHMNCSFQLNMFKLDVNNFATNTWQFPERVFTQDQRPELMVQICEIPSLTGFLDAQVMESVANFVAPATVMQDGKAMKSGKPMKYASPKAAATAVKAAKPFKAQRSAVLSVKEQEQQQQTMSFQVLETLPSSLGNHGIALVSFLGMFVFVVGIFYGVTVFQKRQVQELGDVSSQAHAK